SWCFIIGMFYKQRLSRESKFDLLLFKYFVNMKINILLYIHILIIICGSYVIYKLKIKLTYKKDFKRTDWNQLNDKSINCLQQQQRYKKPMTKASCYVYNP